MKSITSKWQVIEEIDGNAISYEVSMFYGIDQKIIGCYVESENYACNYTSSGEMNEALCAEAISYFKEINSARTDKTFEFKRYNNDGKLTGKVFVFQADGDIHSAFEKAKKIDAGVKLGDE